MMDQQFDIKDTWLYMGLLAAHEEGLVNRYMNEKKGKDQLTPYDVACLEYAGEMRANLRETKEILVRKTLSEKGGQYECRALEKLLSLGVISEKELAVMKLRATMTYTEVAEALGISTSTAFRTVASVHDRVKEICGALSLVGESAVGCEGEGESSASMEDAAKVIRGKMLLAKLSHQQHEIYLLLCKGYSNAEIGLKLGIHGNTVKTQKSRIKKVQSYLDMV